MSGIRRLAIGLAAWAGAGAIATMGACSVAGFALVTVGTYGAVCMALTSPMVAYVAGRRAA